jgi:hypothetical protein
MKSYFSEGNERNWRCSYYSGEKARFRKTNSTCLLPYADLDFQKYMKIEGRIFVKREETSDSGIVFKTE